MIDIIEDRVSTLPFTSQEFFFLRYDIFVFIVVCMVMVDS